MLIARARVRLSFAGGGADLQVIAQTLLVTLRQRWGKLDVMAKEDEPH